MLPKTYVHADYVPEGSRWYLTAGKRYLLTVHWAHDDITDDEGSVIAIHIPSCPHLEGAAWTVTHD